VSVLVEGEYRGLASEYTWVERGRTIGEAALVLLRIVRGLRKPVVSLCSGGVNRGDGDAASIVKRVRSISSQDHCSLNQLNQIVVLLQSDMQLGTRRRQIAQSFCAPLVVRVRDSNHRRTRNGGAKKKHSLSRTA